MDKLSPLDNVFCFLEQANAPMQIGGLMILDQSTAPNGFLRHKELLQYVQDRLHLSKGFRRRIVDSPYGIDYPYSVEDENFDIEFHVRHMGLPSPGDWRQLSILTARIMSRPLDMQRPPWELYIIERLDNVEGTPENSFAVILKVHHAIADGMSATEMVTALMQESPDQAAPRQTRPWISERAPGRLEMWARAAPNLAGQVFRSALYGGKALGGALKLRQKIKQAGVDAISVPRTRFNDGLTPHRIFDARQWPITDVKKVCKLIDGAKINDVMVSVIGGALRHYLQELSELPNDSLVALCPISVRPSNAEKDGGNLVSGMRIQVGSNISTPTERLQNIVDQSEVGKTVVNDNMAESIDSALAAIPPIATSMTKALTERFKLMQLMPPVVNTLITNVPSPVLHADLYLAGAKIVSTFGIPPLVHGMGLGHVVGNSKGKVNISVGADRTLLTQPDTYMACLEKSFQEHLDALAIKLAGEEKKAPVLVKSKQKKTSKKVSRTV